MSRKRDADARYFTVTLEIRENGPGRVIASESNTPNTFEGRVPAGLIGVREGLRIAGNQVREYYRNTQRELDLKEKLERRRRSRDTQVQASPPQPGPAPEFQVPDGPLGAMIHGYEPGYEPDWDSQHPETPENADATPAAEPPESREVLEQLKEKVDAVYAAHPPRPRRRRSPHTGGGDA